MDNEKLLRGQQKNTDEIQVNQSVNESLNQNINENLILQNEQGDQQSDLVAQLNLAMPPVMENAEAQNLQANQQEVVERTEIERNMPNTHTSISGARQRIAESGRTKNSEKMTLVLDKTDILLKQLEYAVVSPCSDDEFNATLSEVKRNYDELITACRLYVKAAKKPRTKPGVRRLNIVKDILLQAESERMLLTDSATRLRNVNKADEHNIITFDNVLENMTATSVDAADGELMEADDMSKQLVIASKLAESIGAGDMVPSAEMKAFRTGDGLQNFVSVRKNDLPKDPQLAEKNLNTGNIIKAIATNATPEAMASLLSSIKESEAKADKDILNNLLTSSVDDLILSFGSIYTEESAKAFRESLKIFKQELVKSGLDKDLELYVIEQNDNVTVSLFTAAEKAKQVEKNNIPIAENEKNGLLKEGNAQNTLVHVTQEPALTQDVKKENAEWVDQTDKPLFDHEPNINDVKQGSIGDCYLLSALGNVVYSSPETIKEMMRDNGDGTVTVRFYEFDSKAKEHLSPIYVKVKKSVPKVNGWDVYAEGSLWVQILEKAFVCSGLATNMQELFDMMERGHIQYNESVDLRNYHIYSRLESIKASGSTEAEQNQNPYIFQRKNFQDLSGGLSQVAIPLITGKYMKDTDINSAGLYWHDTEYSNNDEESEFYGKKDLTGNAKFYSLISLNDKKADEYVVSLMSIHDDVKEADVTKKNLEIDKENEEIYAKIKEFKEKASPEELEEFNKLSKKELHARGLLPKEKQKFRRRDKRAGYANNQERTRGLYFMYTGQKLDEETAETEEAKAKMQVCDEFVKGFIKFSDKNFDLSVKDLRAEKILFKLMRDYKREFVDSETDEAKKALRRTFLASDDYLKTCKWLKEKMQTPRDERSGRFTNYSGNYYGKALELYENIKEALSGKRAITVAFGHKLELAGQKRMGSKAKRKNVEIETDGIYAGHAYSVTGVTERTFGGKTYKFVILRNPWGHDGTEYFYNTKLKRLDRRKASDAGNTNGYTMVELSDYVMYGRDAFIQDTEGIGGKPQ